MINYWLMKSEPSCFSIDDLYTAPNQTTCWDGVRNYQARNFMREMKVGDQAFFYHSNSNPPGIAGIAEIVKPAYPDYTAFDPESEHPDLRSSIEKPIWFMVDLCFKKKFNHLISLSVLRNNPLLDKMVLLRKGNRLSVMPVTQLEWDIILELM